MLKRIAVVIAALSLLASCSKSVEGESKSWERNTTGVTQLQALYPSFKKPLAEQLTKADAMMKEARSEKADDKKIEMMAAANKALSTGLVGRLQAVDRQSKKLRKKMIDVPGMATDEADRISAKAAADDAQRLLARADEALKTGADNEIGAIAVVDRVASDLKTAEDNLGTVERRIREKKNAAEEAAAAAADKAKAPGVAATPTKAATPDMWTCEYCGASNKMADMKCASCGAPHKAKK